MKYIKLGFEPSNFCPMLLTFALYIFHPLIKVGKMKIVNQDYGRYAKPKSYFFSLFSEEEYPLSNRSEWLKP